MKRNNRGFTVVELIVSVALLAVILVPVAGFFINSFKIQSQTSMKSSITRVGQYLVENFKNKNYLDDELKNDSGETFTTFVEGITLLNSAQEDEEPDYSLDEGVKANRNWKLSYKGIDYNVDISIDGFTPSDMSDFEIPDEWGGQVGIKDDGSFDTFYTDVLTYDIGDSFINPIDNQTYVANYPTIVLQDGYALNDNGIAVLWIKNDYGEDNASWEKIRIIKEFKEDLQVYIEGYNISILKGQEGDGASSSQTRITSSYVGEEVEVGKNSASELWLDALMIITRVNDATVRDTFEFSFPVNYDYSKEGE